jgi:hypothetical protein
LLLLDVALLQQLRRLLLQKAMPPDAQSRVIARGTIQFSEQLQRLVSVSAGEQARHSIRERLRVEEIRVVAGLVNKPPVDEPVLHLRFEAIVFAEGQYSGPAWTRTRDLVLIREEALLSPRTAVSVIEAKVSHFLSFASGP